MTLFQPEHGGVMYGREIICSNMGWTENWPAALATENKVHKDGHSVCIAMTYEMYIFNWCCPWETWVGG